MATSGSRDFTLDVADVIEEAYERCGISTGYEAETARGSLILCLLNGQTEALTSGQLNWVQALTTGTATYSLSAQLLIY